ncbi:hypothetical protein BDV95DRAFT_88816 [Massariosphaeria phaeospora]|uniref:Uncharacterized protein n=1 Tax=Massariosphaeria phaeospora TaxID=100035 RepID=A0A7C8I3D5_9PLEO|nr:hypothetical protein BDV95DRAFT_88816 [Massariosphaeria phaeospora]
MSAHVVSGRLVGYCPFGYHSSRVAVNPRNQRGSARRNRATEICKRCPLCPSISWSIIIFYSRWTSDRAIYGALHASHPVIRGLSHPVAFFGSDDLTLQARVYLRRYYILRYIWAALSFVANKRSTTVQWIPRVETPPAFALKKNMHERAKKNARGMLTAAQQT